MHAAACQAYRPASWDAAIASRAAAQASSAASADSTDSADAPARTEHHHRHHGERRHPLVAAMTEALRNLMPADTSTADSSEVQDSARAFAHELSDALRGSDGGRRGLRRARDGGNGRPQQCTFVHRPLPLFPGIVPHRHRTVDAIRAMPAAR